LSHPQPIALRPLLAATAPSNPKLTLSLCSTILDAKSIVLGIRAVLYANELGVTDGVGVGDAAGFLVALGVGVTVFVGVGVSGTPPSPILPPFPPGSNVRVTVGVGVAAGMVSPV
jgi:hypothetical protein